MTYKTNISKTTLEIAEVAKIAMEKLVQEDKQLIVESVKGMFNTWVYIKQVQSSSKEAIEIYASSYTARKNCYHLQSQMNVIFYYTKSKIKKILKRGKNAIPFLMNGLHPHFTALSSISKWEV